MNILKDKKELFFQINITQFCPLNCSHCYILEEERKIKKFLNREDYLKFFKHIVNIIDYYSKKYNFVTDVFLQILGGEPLSNNVEYYKILLEDIIILKKEIYTKYKLNLDLEVSTSLYANKFINDEWMSLFKDFNKNNLIISTSFEHDTNRFNDKTLNKWLNNVQILTENNIKLDLNYILTRKNVEKLYENDEFTLNLFKKFNSIYMYYFISYGTGKINADKLLPSYNKTIEILNRISNNYYNFEINGLFKDNNLITFEEDELFNINLTVDGKINYNLDVFDINFQSEVNEESSKIISNINKYINWNINKKQKYIKENCLNCEYLNICKGGFEEYSNINFFDFDDCKGFKRLRKILKN